MSRLSLWPPLVLPFLAGACGTPLFHDDFDQDNVGQPPSLSPAGNPVGDSIEVTGPAGSAIVIDAGPLAGGKWFFASEDCKALRITRPKSTKGVGVDCIPEGGPYSDGVIWVTYNAACDHLTPGPVLSVNFMSSDGGPLGGLDVGGGKFVGVGSTSQVATKGYLNEEAHKIVLRLDLDNKVLSGFVYSKAGYGAGLFGSLDLLDKPTQDFAKLTFSYPGTLAEGFEGTYVIDDLQITREPPEDLPLIVTQEIVTTKDFFGGTSRTTDTSSFGHSITKYEAVEGGVDFLISDPSATLYGQASSGVVYSAQLRSDGSWMSYASNGSHYPNWAQFYLGSQNPDVYGSRKTGIALAAPIVQGDATPGDYPYFVALSRGVEPARSILIGSPGNLHPPPAYGQTWSLRSLSSVVVGTHDMATLPNGNSPDRVVVLGESNYNPSGGPQTGGAYVLTWDEDNFQILLNTSANGFTGILEADAHFGTSLDSMGIVGDDAFEDIVVGAPGYSGTLGGAVWILLLDENFHVDDQVELTGPGINFGEAVAGIGNLDDDNCPDLAIRNRSDLGIFHLERASDGSIVIAEEMWISPPEGVIYKHDLASLGDPDGDGPIHLALLAGIEETDGDKAYPGFAIILLREP